jgi:hypothetical protein
VFFRVEICRVCDNANENVARTRLAKLQTYRFELLPLKAPSAVQTARVLKLGAPAALGSASSSAAASPESSGRLTADSLAAATRMAEDYDGTFYATWEQVIASKSK